MVGHSSRRQESDFLLARHRRNKWIKPFFNFRQDQSLTPLRAVNDVDMIVAIEWLMTKLSNISLQ